ncbi:hypothetical protein M885DRAFT_610486 [Pelagophyceae sp. CCMP2097]|nr:hypothetical protein M885DRAFT_610486 [Pelagophyceae sp. CCMP2097]
MAAPTPDAIAGILQNRIDRESFHPTVIDVRRIANNGTAGDRYRLVISDAEYFTQCMAASQINEVITRDEDKLETGCMIRLENYIVNQVQGKGIIILLGVTVLSGPTDRIGAPASFNGGAAAPSPAAPLGGPRAAPTAAPAAKAEHSRAAPAAAPSSNPQGVKRISELNPYMQRFVLKARLTAKGPMKHWDKGPDSKGNLCAFDLTDASGEIRCTMFKETATKYHGTLKEGVVYVITDNSARLKKINAQWNTLDHEFEITMSNNVLFEEVTDDGSITMSPGNWVKLSAMASVELPHAGGFDVVAVFKDVGPAAQITSKKGNELIKRECTLVDDSGYDVRCTLWGQEAQHANEFYEERAASFRGLKASDFGGISVSIGFSGNVNWGASECMPEAMALQKWWNHGGSSAPSQALTTAGGGGGGGRAVAFSERIPINDIKARQLGCGETAEYATVKGTCTFIKTDRMWYEACCKCHKKVTQNSDGSWQCEKCNETAEGCDHRYMMSVMFIDESGQSWASAFNETGAALLGGHLAPALAAYKEDLGGEDGKFDEYIKNQFLHKRYVLKLRVKNEVWQEQARIKCSIIACAPVDFAEESRHMIKALAA